MPRRTFLSKFKTVGFRISLTAGFLILLSVVVGYTTYQTSGNYRRDAEAVTALAERTITVFETDVLIYKLVRAEKDFVLTAEDEFKNERIDFSNQVDVNLDNLIENSLNLETRTLLEDLKQKKVDYDKNFINAVEIFKNAKEQAQMVASRRGISATTTSAIVELDQRSADILEKAFQEVEELSLSNTQLLLSAETDLISKIVNANTSAIDDTLAQARTNSQNVRYISLFALFAALVVGIFVSVVVIRSVTRSLRSIVERLVRLVGVLRDSVGQATEVADSNASTASQLASSTDQQSKQVEEITVTISQTAAAITGTSELAQEGNAQAQEANTLAQKGGEEGEKAVDSLKSIAEIVKDAVERIKNLAVRSREVGDLAGEVTNIADQTNILALNAAIEAARAGEAGRGFAVVADEVRRLAEGSRKFADQITDLINSVVQQAQDTTQTTSEGAKNIEQSTQNIQGTLTLFQTIQSVVSSANSKIQDISSKISQQADAAEQISKTATSISQGIEQNASGAKNLANAADQQKVTTSVIQKSLEEAEILLGESRVMVGLKEEDLEEVAEEVVEEQEEVRVENVAQEQPPKIETKSKPEPEPQKKKDNEKKK